jgi:pimeloyl-ACP methyl ester carboxylesterase
MQLRPTNMLFIDDNVAPRKLRAAAMAKGGYLRVKARRAGLKRNDMADFETSSSTPGWFTRAIAAPVESRFVEVEGCEIHYLRWGDPRRPGLLMVPAGGGHAHWFGHVAPLLADRFHVVSIDLAGCGDSGRRPSYSQEQISAEIIAVCADAGMFEASIPPTLLGHSAGAQFVLRTAIAFDDRLLGVISLDGLRYAALAKDPGIAILSGPRPVPRPAKIHASYEEAVSRFRLSPAPQIPIGHDYIIEHIARHSYREVEGGWTLKYDPSQILALSLSLDIKDRLAALRCRAAAIYAEHTHIADETVHDALDAATEGTVPVFVIPGTSHYPPIDSPLAFVATIRAILAAWIAEIRRSGASPNAATRSSR